MCKNVLRNFGLFAVWCVDFASRNKMFERFVWFAIVFFSSSLFFYYCSVVLYRFTMILLIFFPPSRSLTRALATSYDRFERSLIRHYVNAYNFRCTQSILLSIRKWFVAFDGHKIIRMNYTLFSAFCLLLKCHPMRCMMRATSFCVVIEAFTDRLS